MKSRVFYMRPAIIALFIVNSLNPALAQQIKGTLYSLHTNPDGGCPGLDWHIIVQGNNLEGFVAWDKGKHMARLDGRLVPAGVGKERSFMMDAQEVGGVGRKAIVSGTVGGDVINVSIEGSGTACDGKILPVPRVVGGMGGGGG